MTTRCPALSRGEQVDPAPGVLPVAELLGYDQKIGAEHGDVVAEESLQVLALVEPEGGEPDRVVPPQASVVDLVQWHAASSPLRLTENGALLVP
ncbi:hypothetical protein [Micromonospora sp. NPDC047740]|uniref:hypothetical protein n=1 Tax=Micromonospora sp. NPDC047740 TaxID=3364254 RepID=UPI00371D0B9F